MTKSLRRILRVLALLVAVGFLPGTSDVQACPSCKNANETDTLRPTAYMYSILFMLGMPATVFAGFGVAFYRLSRRSELEQLAMMQDEAPQAPLAD